jgi:hypothetical protein
MSRAFSIGALALKDELAALALGRCGGWQIPLPA